MAASIFFTLGFRAIFNLRVCLDRFDLTLNSSPLRLRQLRLTEIIRVRHPLLICL